MDWFIIGIIKSSISSPSALFSFALDASPLKISLLPFKYTHCVFSADLETAFVPISVSMPVFLVLFLLC